jgi:FkbM family methyltransferase
MTLLAKIRFAIGYGLSKLALLWEVKSPRWTFFAFELRYSFANWWHGLRDVKQERPVLYNGPSLIKTVMGDYEVRPGTQDAAIISPAFERADWDELISVLESESRQAGEIWFLDVGANIGTFSVRMAKLYPAIRTWAFEPAPANIRILERNLALNAAGRAMPTVCPVAVSDANGEALLQFSALQPGDSHLETSDSVENAVRVQTKRLDQLVPRPPVGTTIVAKLDVEGHEQKVLDGMKGLLDSGAACWMWIEDIFHTEALYAKLHDLGFRFERKITPYNSWWMRPGDTPISSKAPRAA